MRFILLISEDFSFAQTLIPARCSIEMTIFVLYFLLSNSR